MYLRSLVPKDLFERHGYRQSTLSACVLYFHLVELWVYWDAKHQRLKILIRKENV